MLSTEFSVSGFTVKVDYSDAHLLREYKWVVSNDGYVRRNVRDNGRLKTVYLHRVVAGASEFHDVVDHISGDKLDNTRSNLRVGSCESNLKNQKKKKGCASRWKGAALNSRTGKWQVQIRVEGKLKFIKYCSNEIEAAFLYDLASLKYHGDFGRRNFLPLCF